MSPQNEVKPLGDDKTNIEDLELFKAGWPIVYRFADVTFKLSSWFLVIIAFQAAKTAYPSNVLNVIYNFLSFLWGIALFFAISYTALYGPVNLGIKGGWLVFTRLITMIANAFLTAYIMLFVVGEDVKIIQALASYQFRR